MFDKAGILFIHEQARGGVDIAQPKLPKGFRMSTKIPNQKCTYFQNSPA